MASASLSNFVSLLMIKPMQENDAYRLYITLMMHAHSTV